MKEQDLSVTKEINKERKRKIFKIKMKGTEHKEYQRNDIKAAKKESKEGN